VAKQDAVGMMHQVLHDIEELVNIASEVLVLQPRPVWGSIPSEEAEQ